MGGEKRAGQGKTLVGEKTHSPGKGGGIGLGEGCWQYEWHH